LSIHRPSRLTLRIYLVSLVQLAVVGGVIGLIGWLSFKAHGPGEFLREGRYALESVAKQRGDPASMQREAKRVRSTIEGKLSLYAEDGTLLVGNVEPPLPPLSRSELSVLRERGEVTRSGRPPTLAVPLWSGDQGIVYGLFAPGRRLPPPPRALWALLVALVAAAVAAVVLARSFARPLRALAETARAFGAGDLTARARMSRRDEFGELADAFDDMAQRVAQLVRSQQQLLADVSHELRTPLARIRVALDLAAEGDADTARQALAEISSDLGELERLIADVLQTTRLDLAAGRAEHALPPLRKEDIVFHNLLHHACARFQSNYPRRTLHGELPDTLPIVRGDAALLRRALDNLLDNAVAYSEEDKPVILRVIVEPDVLELQVIDQGMGIAAEHLQRIGTPFYRTDRSRARRTGGLGLGVSLSQRIVEAHTGTLVLESELGIGTRARIRLPLSKEG
jgi:signal transduction histidine kinase